MSDRLLKSLDFLDGHLLAKAVILVFRENQAEESNEGATIKASSDAWGLFGPCRDNLYRRTRDHWCQIVGKDQTFWPYSVDAVVRMYFRYRKRNEEEIAGFEREIEDAFKS